MPAPFEIIAAPFTAWLAPVATAFPAINVAVAGAWVKVGTSGDLNYMDSGVKVRHSHTIALWRALGDGGPRKAFRSEEELRISLVLADLTLEQYLLALNHNAVTETGISRKLGLSRGLAVVQKALLIRGAASPYAEGLNLQYEVPIAVQTGEPEPVFRKNEPAGLALEWTALIDPSASSVAERFGRLVADDGAP